MKLKSDEGNALLEGITFAVMSFSLVLGSGLQLFDVQQRILELNDIARNALRAYLLEQNTSVSQQVVRFQKQSLKLAQTQLEQKILCRPDCYTQSSVVYLTLSADGLTAHAFGVITN